MISNGLLYFILLAIVSITGHAAARATSSSARALRKDRERNAGKSNRKADRESRDANILSKKCTVPEDLGPGPGAHQAETEKVPEVGYRDVYDEKQEFQDFVRGWNQPQVQDIGDENPQLDCLPLFRSRTGEIVGMQPGAEGYSSQSSGETMEDMEKVELRRRRKQELRRSLRVVIPTGHTNVSRGLVLPSTCEGRLRLGAGYMGRKSILPRSPHRASPPSPFSTHARSSSLLRAPRSLWDT